jgi:hypothetical protein
MADTIEIRMPESRIEDLGGDRAWKEALGLANAAAVNQGWSRLVSPRYADCVITADPMTQEVVFTFGADQSLDFTQQTKSVWLATVAV